MTDEKHISGLDKVEKGRYIVVSLGGGRGFVRKLTDLGIYPGAGLEVLNSDKGGGPLRLSIKGGHFGLGRGVASRIYVRKAEEDFMEEKKYSLRDYKEGQKGKIIDVKGGGKFKKRILEMGFIRGAEIFVEKYAPLRDPIEIIIKSYHVSLRRNEAENIIMSEPRF